MKRDLVLWTVFVEEIEKLFIQFNFPGGLWSKIFKNELTEPYLDFLERVKHLTGSGSFNSEMRARDLCLVSIFSKVQSERHPSTGYYSLPFISLSESEGMFPFSADDWCEEKAVDDLKSLLAEFSDQLIAYLDGNDSPDFETFYYLAQKYLWCVPALVDCVQDTTSQFPKEQNNKSFPGVRGAVLQKSPLGCDVDVSLFEHLKSRAAAAVVLMFITETGEDVREKPFSLVGFDISGIQDFIYTIASKGAAKSLKGRSLHLQLLEMAITRYILDTFHLPVTNIVYSGGGKGFILAPAFMNGHLPRIESEINMFLFNELGTQISVGIAGVDFDPGGFKRFNTILDEVINVLNKKKKQKFSSFMAEKYADLFNPQDMDMESLETCSICGKEGRPVVVEEEVRWCSQCNKFREIGWQLSKAQAIIEKRWENNEAAFTFETVLNSYEFLFQGESDMVLSDSRFIYFLNDTESFSRAVQKRWRAGFLFMAGNKAPVKENSQEPADFDDIADASEGTKKLGVIRGDVDNLGTIFSIGLGPSISLERIAQLSFLMKHFFCSMINLCFTHEKKEFIVYSGGDDFFIVGPWSNLIDDLAAFRTMFEKYTGFNKVFSFSASFSLFGGRYPAFKFAEVAGNMEQEAKENKAGDLEKNSICFMGKTVFWEDFFKLKEVEEYLVELVRDETIPKSYIQLLQRISQYDFASERKGKTETELLQSARFHRWKWYYSWQAARLLERKKNKDPVRNLLAILEDFLFKSVYGSYGFINNDPLYLIEVPAR